MKLESVITASETMDKLKRKMCQIDGKLLPAEHDAFMDKVTFYLERFEYYLKDVQKKLKVHGVDL